MSTVKSTLQYAIALIVFSAFVWGMWLVSKDGLSSLWVKDALDHDLIRSADKAISLNGKNPDAYYARASFYRKNGQTTEAIKDLERAAYLRPGDHYFRVELGYTRYLAGDVNGAISDFEAASRLAPFYAQPRWYLGNLLIQAGRLDEGFAELRRAVKSDSFYVTDTIQRAVEVYDGDPVAIVRAVNPESAETRLALERYFIQHDNIPAAMELFKTGKDMPADFLRALFSELLTAKRFSDAHEVWLATKEGTRRPQSKEPSSISDGGFESEIDADAMGFDWQIARPLEKIRITRDAKELYHGGYSLQIEYNGNSNPSTKVLSQLILVEPNTNYRLSFAAQTKDMVTGGLPLITIIDAADGHLLAQSSALPEGTSSWQEYDVDCTTTLNMQAVLIAIQRGACSSTPCPVYGRIWLDDFNWRSR